MSNSADNFFRILCVQTLKVVGKTKEDCRVVINGAGSAGIAISKLLLNYGFKHLILCDKSGILNKQSENLKAITLLT